MKIRIAAAGVLIAVSLALFPGCGSAGNEGESRVKAEGTMSSADVSADSALEIAPDSVSENVSYSMSESAPGAESGAISESVAENVDIVDNGANGDTNSMKEKQDAANQEAIAVQGTDAYAEDLSETSLPEDDLTETVGNVSEAFYAVPIPDDIFAKMQGKTYKDYCPIPREDLRYVHVLHKNMEGETLEGELICHEIIAQDLLEIFRELYEQSYPIEKIRLMDEYDADDESGMTDNNSSCFNYRTISRSNVISKHGLGVAVDINPLYNPYTKIVDGERIVEPAAGWPYIDREAEFPYKIVEGDLCYQLFTDYGFEWGGYWRRSKDYQHFELPDSRIYELRERYEN